MPGSPTPLHLFLDRLDARPRQVVYQEWLSRQSSWRPLPGLEARRLMKGLVHALAAWGLGPDDRVGVLAGPSLRATLAEWAIMARGGCVVSLREGHPPHELRSMLDEADVRVAFVSADQAPTLAAALVGRKAPLTVIALEPASIPGCRDVVAWHDFLAEGAEFEATEGAIPWEEEARSVPAEAPALLCFSAGSTGRPRMIKHDHSSLVAGTRALRSSGAARKDWHALFALSSADLWVRTLALVVVEEGGVACFASASDSLSRILDATNPEILVLSPDQLSHLYRQMRVGHRKLEGIRKLVVDAALGVAGEWAHKVRGDAAASSLLRAEYAAADFAVLRHIRARFGRHAKRVVCGGAPLGPELLRFYRGVGIDVRHLLTLSEVAGAVGWTSAPDATGPLVFTPPRDLEVSLSGNGTLLLSGPALAPAARGPEPWDSRMEVQLVGGCVQRAGTEVEAERVERGLSFHAAIAKAAVAPHPGGGWSAQVVLDVGRRRNTQDVSPGDGAISSLVQPLVEATNARLPVAGRIEAWSVVSAIDRDTGLLTSCGTLRRRALRGVASSPPASG